MSLSIIAPYRPVLHDLRTMPFQILSLSGGGYLGLYSASLLAALEKQCGRPLATTFDLMAGTSIGGIIALALAAEVPAARIQTAFEEQGRNIFGNESPPRSAFAVGRDLLRKAAKSKHSAAALRATIVGIVGADLRIGDLRHPVLVPSINLSKGSPRIFKTPHHDTFRVDLNLRVVDVAMATSAAPTFFPLAQIGDSLFADGGLYANSPDLLALHEANYFFGTPDANIVLLSIGTTTSHFAVAHQAEPAWGIAQWFSGNRLMNVTIASQQRSVDFMMEHRLGERYVRLDEVQSKEQEQVLGLDVATDVARSTIRALSEGTAQHVVNNKAVSAILANVAPAPRFFLRPDGT